MCMGRCVRVVCEGYCRSVCEKYMGEMCEVYVRVVDIYV